MPETKCGFDDIPGGATGSQLLAFHGPTLLVNIGFDPAYNSPSATSVPIAGIVNVQALVDTGASISCIDSLLAAQLNLPIVDRQAMAGASGRHMTNVYLAQIYVPGLNFTVTGQFLGVDLQAGGQKHNALIGRSFLLHHRMTYDGKTGTVVISRD